MIRSAGCGHRGNASDRPEQTLVAYERALDLGARHIELDVRLTADDQLAVIHDATLERTTNGTGTVAAHTLAELRELDAGSWFSPDFAGQRIPSLAEVMALVGPRAVEPCIEVKADGADEAEHTAALLAGWLDANGHVETVYVSSFHLGALAAAKRAVPRLRLLPWMDEFSPADVPAHIDDAKRLGAVGVFHTASLLDRPQVEKLRAAGLDVWVWSADDADSLLQAVGLGAEVISCSNIAGLVAVTP